MRFILLASLSLLLACPDRGAQTPAAAPNENSSEEEPAADRRASEPSTVDAAAPRVEAVEGKTREMTPEMAERLRARAKSKGAAKGKAVEPPEIDLSCTVAADCAIKNVGNCCGYYPRCVNKDFEPDPDAVKAKCEREGMMGVCGFPEIRSCACKNGQCVSLTSAAE